MMVASSPAPEQLVVFDVHGRPRCRSAPADAPGYHRLVARPPLHGRAAGVRSDERVCRWLHARSRRRDLRERSRHASVPPRQEPDPSPRSRKERGLRTCNFAQTASCHRCLICTNAGLKLTPLGGNFCGGHRRRIVRLAQWQSVFVVCEQISSERTELRHRKIARFIFRHKLSTGRTISIRLRHGGRLTRVHICESSTATNRSQKNDTPYPDKNRHDRTPLFPECRSGFSDPISGDLPGVLRSNFCCRV